MGDGRWEMGDGRWEIRDGRWEMWDREKQPDAGSERGDKGYIPCTCGG